MRIGRYDVVDTGKALWDHFHTKNITGLSAQIAYNALFSTVPLVIFLTALTGVVGRAIGVETVMGSVTDWLFNRSGLPPAAAQLIQTPIEQVL
ncbi:MAG: hypothetical protein IT337_12840, partial [Thermomicrobiales bacterium]|nr:hypothetical protein [Thermomicrobiales bacterium]